MKRKWRWGILIGIAVICIVFASFFDYQINAGLYTPGNGFGIAMAAFGCTPVYICLSGLGVGYALFALKKETKVWLKVILWILCVVAIGASIHLQADMILSRNAFDIEKMWYVGYPIGLVVAALGCTLGYFLFRNVNDPKALIPMIVMPAILVFSFGTVEVIKRIMLRPRFRFIDATLGSSIFCNWWESGRALRESFYDSLPEGYTQSMVKEDFKSFPSGHTVTTTCLIPFLVFLPKIDSKFEKYEPWCFYIGLVWAMIMGFSRMLIGAHFLSDVSFGMLIAGVWSCIADCIIFKNKKEEVKEKEPQLVQEGE